jgi:hypothetical protein
MVQPTDCAVPRISLTVPDCAELSGAHMGQANGLTKDLASDLYRMVRAMETISSNAMLPVCLMFYPNVSAVRMASAVAAYLLLLPVSRRLCIVR